MKCSLILLGVPWTSLPTLVEAEPAAAISARGRETGGLSRQIPRQAPFTVAALRRALREGHEPPQAPAIARLKSYRWFVVGTVCIGAFMGQVDASLARMLLPVSSAPSAPGWVARVARRRIRRTTRSPRCFPRARRDPWRARAGKSATIPVSSEGAVAPEIAGLFRWFCPSLIPGSVPRRIS